MPRTDLAVPFDEKDEAKRLGARWDAVKKVWYVPDGIDPAPFEQWVPEPLKANGQADDEPTIRCNRYYIAEASRACWKCSKPTMVFAFFMPRGHEQPTEDPDAPAGSWDRYEEESSLSLVTYICEGAVAAIRELTTRYRVTQHHGAYWLNHCEHCDALLADWYDHDEFGGAFTPEDAAAAA
jgi:hypothetical protein